MRFKATYVADNSAKIVSKRSLKFCTTISFEKIINSFNIEQLLGKKNVYVCSYLDFYTIVTEIHCKNYCI